MIRIAITVEVFDAIASTLLRLTCSHRRWRM
jgi:hypothetical protein